MLKLIYLHIDCLVNKKINLNMHFLINNLILKQTLSIKVSDFQNEVIFTIHHKSPPQQFGVIAVKKLRRLHRNLDHFETSHLRK